VAKITDANKKEVLTNLVVAEYGTEVEFSAQPGGALIVKVRVDDPARKERAAVRAQIEAAEANDDWTPANVLAAVHQYLNDRDDEAVYAYGEAKGEPRKHETSMWLDESIADIVVDLIRSANISYGTASAVKSALGGERATAKGF
jgi:hypothetical protein